MADLGEFARRIRVHGRNIETNSSDLAKKVAVAINQVVVLATPVDTGRARANWLVGLSNPVTEEVEQEDPSGVSTIAQGNARILTRRRGQTIFISNNVEYINKLNEGSSSQAPAGFVELAVQAGSRAVRGSKIVG